MKRRRSKLEICVAVLLTVKNRNNKPTHIMYEANISWKTLQRILKPLVSQGLVREMDVIDSIDERTKKCYEITQKGENVVKYLKTGKDPQEIEELSEISW